jgi:hypothetical protein
MLYYYFSKKKAHEPAVHAQKTFSVTCPVISGNVTSGDFQ